jgi:hypothetical protein
MASKPFLGSQNLPKEELEKVFVMAKKQSAITLAEPRGLDAEYRFAKQSIEKERISFNPGA